MEEFTREQEQELFWGLCDGIKRKFAYDVNVVGDSLEDIRITKVDMQQPIISRAIKHLEEGGYIQETDDPTIYGITLEYFEYLTKVAK